MNPGKIQKYTYMNATKSPSQGHERLNETYMKNWL